jgi:predicted KAP-like P-loop ATPase
LSSYISDSPIETTDDDRFGVSLFAKSIAKGIVDIDEPVGTVIALNGPWGSGKSSVVNLVRKEIADLKVANLSVTEFKCWWFRGEEALVLAFFKHLGTILKDSFPDKAKGLIKDFTHTLLQLTPTVAPAIAAASGHPWMKFFGDGAKALESAFFTGDSIEKSFKKISDLLKAGDKRFLVIIDDIDRLSPDEALAIFRLIKSVGHLPKVTYLVVFDRELAEKAVQQKYPSEGPHFLEKIIQAAFEVPAPLKTDLNAAALTAIDNICGPIKKNQINRLMNLFHDVVSPCITSPRHLVRFRGAMSVTWPAIANEVDVADFIALEAIRLYEPALFKAIRLNKANLCGVRSDMERSNFRDGRQFEPLLRLVPEDRRERAITALRRLFPRVETNFHGSEWIGTWDAERRVCVEKHFDTYMRLTLSNDALSLTQINEIIARAGESDYIKQTFIEASKARRANGTSMVPVFLDEMTTHAHAIERANVEPFLASLFEIHDEIDLPEDEAKGFMAMANTTFRYHWLIRRLTRDRFDLEERTDLYERCMENASFRWLVDFAQSAQECYREENGRRLADEDCLVSEEAVNRLKERALMALRTAASDGSLLGQGKLLRFLYMWRHFSGDATEVKAYTDSLLSNDAAVLALVRASTSVAWSAGIGFDGLGDRVGTPTTQVAIEEGMDILDIAKFREAIERLIADAGMSVEQRDELRAFLDVWDRGRRRPQRTPDADAAASEAALEA